MIAAIPVGVTTGSFLSGDGTLMGYRQMGKGPGLVLLHGALQSSRSFTSLGAALSDAFTIYIPDRRGRGLSGPFGDNHSMRTETEDLEALLDKTGSHHVFALSAGALVALQCALESPAIHRLAIYEPPLEIGRRPSPARCAAEGGLDPDRVRRQTGFLQPGRLRAGRHSLGDARRHHGAGGVRHDGRKTLHGDHHHDGEFSQPGQAGADHRRGQSHPARQDRCLRGGAADGRGWHAAGDRHDQCAAGRDGEGDRASASSQPAALPV